MYFIQLDATENLEINYDLSLKSPSGEITVYAIQPDLAKTYDNKILELRLQDNLKGIKRNKEEEDKKEEVKPNKRKAGR